MKKLVKKANRIGELFIDGALDGLTTEGTMEVTAMVSLYQGLKYNGSLKRGVKTGAVVLTGLCCLNGIRRVVENRHLI